MERLKNKHRLGYFNITDAIASLGPSLAGWSIGLVSSATGSATEVAYPQVKRVKGNNFSTGAKVAIGVGIGIAILLLVFKDQVVAY